MGGVSDEDVEIAARGIHDHQEYSTCWDDDKAGSRHSRRGVVMSPLGEHGRVFYRDLARAALVALERAKEAK